MIGDNVDAQLQKRPNLMLGDNLFFTNSQVQNVDEQTRKRIGFKIKEYAEKNKLGPPKAVNFYYTEYQSEELFLPK